jgi:hypothetical protein
MSRAGLSSSRNPSERNSAISSGLLRNDSGCGRTMKLQRSRNGASAFAKCGIEQAPLPKVGIQSSVLREGSIANSRASAEVSRSGE